MKKRLNDIGNDLIKDGVNPVGKCICMVGALEKSVTIQGFDRFSEAHFPVTEQTSAFLGLSGERRFITIRATCSASKLARIMGSNCFKIEIKGFADQVAGDGGENYTPLLAHVSAA